MVDERVRKIYEKKYEHIAEPSTSVGKEDEGKGELWLVKLPPGSLLEDFDGITVKIHSDTDKKKVDEKSVNDLNADGEFEIAPNEIGRFDANKANGGDDNSDNDNSSLRYRIVQSGGDGAKALRAVYVRGGDMKKALTNAEMITKRVHLLRTGFKRRCQKVETVIEEDEEKVEEKKTKTKKASTPSRTNKKRKKK